MARILVNILINLLFLTSALAQPDSALITLEEAINRALEDSPDIVVARNDQEIAANNQNIGNAGLLPSLSLNAGYQEQLNNTNIEFASPEQPPINRDGARSTTYNASVQLNYNLFGGLEKYNRYQGLVIRNNLADVQTRLTIESTIAQMLNLYLEAARLSEQVEINQEAVEISLERLARLEERYDFGAATKLEVLNAEVDLNTDSINLVQSLKNLANQKRSVKILMGQPPEADYLVESDFFIHRSLELETILDKALQKNANLVLAQYNRQNAEVQTDVARAGNYPRLDLSASYGYNRQENEAGFIKFQETLGFTGGVNLSYNIFNGSQQKIAIQNAEISLANSEENIRQARLQVKRDVLNAFANYETNIYLLELAQEDLSTTRLNLVRSEEAYLTGQINSTEYRNAQLNLIQAANRINELEIQAKLSEIELFRLSGGLLQEIDH